MRTIVAALLTGVLAVPSIQPERAPQADVWRDFASKLRPGESIKVRLEDRTRLEGTFIHVAGDMLYVLPRSRRAVPVRALPLADIASIERPRTPGRAFLRAFLEVTAIMGAVVLLVIASYSGEDF